MRRRHNKWTLIITFASLVLIIILITIAFLVAKGILSERNKDSNNKGGPTDVCQEESSTCSIQLVETIPKVLVYPDSSPKHTETADAWKELIKMANSSINIISFYWTLTSEDTKPGSHFPQAKVGEEILAGLVAAADRGIVLRLFGMYL